MSIDPNTVASFVGHWDLSNGFGIDNVGGKCHSITTKTHGETGPILFDANYDCQLPDPEAPAANCDMGKNPQYADVVTSGIDSPNVGGYQVHELSNNSIFGDLQVGWTWQALLTIRSAVRPLPPPAVNQGELFLGDNRGSTQLGFASEFGAVVAQIGMNNGDLDLRGAVVRNFPLNTPLILTWVYNGAGQTGRIEIGNEGEDIVDVVGYRVNDARLMWNGVHSGANPGSIQPPKMCDIITHQLLLFNTGLDQATRDGTADFLVDISGVVGGGSILVPEVAYVVASEVAVSPHTLQRYLGGGAGGLSNAVQPPGDGDPDDPQFWFNQRIALDTTKGVIGDPIDEWENAAGPNYTATGSERPTYPAGIVTSDGVDDRFTSSLTFATMGLGSGYTYVALFNPIATTANAMFYGSNAPLFNSRGGRWGCAFKTDGTIGVHMNDGTPQQLIEPISFGVVHAIGVIWDTVDLKLTLDGAAFTSIAAGIILSTNETIRFCGNRAGFPYMEMELMRFYLVDDIRTEASVLDAVAFLLAL